MRFVIIFLLATLLDVRIQARALEIPKNCQDKGVACAILSEVAIEDVSTSAYQVRATKGSSFVRKSETALQVVRGLFRVQAKDAVEVHALYGRLAFTQGEVLIEASDGIVRFTNLSSPDLKYEPRGEGQLHLLPVGFSTYFTKITKSGVAEAGYPRPAEIEPLIKKWAQSFFDVRSEKLKFSSDLKTFMQAWHEATKLVGPWYLDTVEREIASQRAEEARLARLRAEREAEERQYREMFRQRIMEPGSY